jgi:hypothetical protein
MPLPIHIVKAAVGVAPPSHHGSLNVKIYYRNHGAERVWRPSPPSTSGRDFLAQGMAAVVYAVQ